MSETGNKSASSEPKQLSQQLPAERYIIDKIMPARAIHLIGGPSGSGKSTLMVQIQEDWTQSRPVFGYDSFPRPYLYMPCDRTGASFQMTMERMDTKLSIPTYSLVDNNISMTVEGVITKARQIDPNVKVLFIDAIGRLVPGGKINDYATVSSWLAEVNRRCQQQDITIVGLGHSAKTKEGEGYNNPRQRFLGSVAWGGLVETMIFIEPGNVKDATDPARRITVLPRNAPDFILNYRFNDAGRLVDTAEESGRFVFENYLQRLPYDVVITTAQLLEAGQGTSRRTVESWIKSQVEMGLLHRVRPGQYQKIRTN